MLFSSLSRFYTGFYLNEPCGNNAFSFESRTARRLYIPPFRNGTPRDFAIGDEAAFVEMANGLEVVCPGLREFVHIARDGKDIFIFDNHNHAFVVWCAAARVGALHQGATLVHVDQHKDTRDPDRFLSPDEARDPEAAFRYTNFELNVGNFIPPALRLGFFSRVVHVAGQDAFETDPPEGFVLDIDLDIFAPIALPQPRRLNRVGSTYAVVERDGIDHLRAWSDQASLITIATSPYFMEQAAAIRLAQELL